MENINNISKLTDEEKIKTVLANYNDIAKDYVINFWNDTCDNKYIDGFLNDLPGKKILDLGCGIGKDEYYISNKGYDIIGIDFAENVIKEAKNKFPSCKFEIKDLTDLNYPSNSFDGIIFINTLFHIPEKKLFNTFKNINRILKSNGKMLMIFQEGEKEFLQEEPLKKGNYVYMHEYTFEFINSVLNAHNLKIYNFERENENDKNCPINKKLILYIEKKN